VTVLRRQSAGRRALSWADRAFIAALISGIPRARLASVPMIVSPETVLRWHRGIVRRRWAAKSRHERPGRPATRRDIRGLILRLGRQNPQWGYRRIHGELAGLGIRLAASTVWETLRKAGIDPAPRQIGPTWIQPVVS
jgi:putative transposase